MESGTLKVPQAQLYYEARGSGPLLLMIPGGPMDAGGFAELQAALEDRFRTVAYDPRGNSRSTFDDAPVRQDMDVHADDAAALIEKFGAPAYVLGSSGGAQIGLNLVARHPSLVKRLVAHEPPCRALLPEAEANATREGFDDVLATHRREGPHAGFMAFLKTTGMGAPTPPAEPPPPEALAAMARVMANVPYFIEHGVAPISSFVPDVAALTGARVIVGVGATSKGQLANRSALALAERLGRAPVEFPGGHVGYREEVPAFADILARVLS